nr:hypothetical protein [uncultured Desulfobulbus sp.]
MKVVTEATLRDLSRKNGLAGFRLEPGQILTPSAASFLNERQIKIVSPEAPEQPLSAPEPQSTNSSDQRQDSRYVSALDGGGFAEKPEHMTHLCGNRLIPKDHPRIIFRGKLDSLQSAMLLVQGLAEEKKLAALTADLGELLEWCREIMKVDVLERPLEQSTVLDLSPEELRQQSHHPKKYYGIGHITPAVSMGPVLLALNDLRSRVREVETLGVAAFRQEFTTGRTDILQALNRMSSAMYILMIREQAGYYNRQQDTKKAYLNATD